MAWGTLRAGLVFLLAAFCWVGSVAHADLLRVHAISPPRSTDWSSPRSLLQSTIRNSVRSTYSPSGHILIHLETPAGQIMTSMASARRTQTFSVTVIKQLGLSSLYYDFEGTLDSAQKSQDLIRRARRDHRLATLEIEIDSGQSAQMVEFLKAWIRSGAFQHYRGGQIASQLQGAGCADFVIWFLNVATRGRAPLKNWMRELHLPLDLLSETRPDEILKRQVWANPGEGRFFMIPDPELIVNWIRNANSSQNQLGEGDLKIRSNELDRFFPAAESHFSASLIQTTSPEPIGPRIDEPQFQKVWSTVLTPIDQTRVVTSRDE
jgi:hypothetical protein